MTLKLYTQYMIPVALIIAGSNGSGQKVREGSLKGKRGGKTGRGQTRKDEGKGQRGGRQRKVGNERRPQQCAEQGSDFSPPCPLVNSDDPIKDDYKDKRGLKISSGDQRSNCTFMCQLKPCVRHKLSSVTVATLRIGSCLNGKEIITEENGQHQDNGKDKFRNALKCHRSQSKPWPDGTKKMSQIFAAIILLSKILGFKRIRYKNKSRMKSVLSSNTILPCATIAILLSKDMVAMITEKNHLFIDLDSLTLKCLHRGLPQILSSPKYNEKPNFPEHQETTDAGIPQSLKTNNDDKKTIKTGILPFTNIEEHQEILETRIVQITKSDKKQEIRSTGIPLTYDTSDEQDNLKTGILQNPKTIKDQETSTIVSQSTQNDESQEVLKIGNPASIQINKRIDILKTEAEHSPENKDQEVLMIKTKAIENTDKYSKIFKLQKSNEENWINIKRLKRKKHPIFHYHVGHQFITLHAYPVFPPASHNFMRYEILRLRSFNKSSSMKRHSASQLAQAGFYLANQEGLVTCFNCEISHPEFLSKIALNINAHKSNCEQKRAETNIPLFKGTDGLTLADLAFFDSTYGSGRSFSSSFHTDTSPSPNQGASYSQCMQVSEPESSDLNHVYSVYTSAAVGRPLDFNPYSKAWRGSNDSNQLNIGGLSSGATYDDFLDLRGAAYPLFASHKKRRDTFQSWDPTHTQKPDHLVGLGFFYAGYSDCARCFYCGLGLKYWRPNDDAAYQHARFRPLCKYNQFVKGQEFIDQVQRNIAAEDENDGQNVSGGASGDITEVPNLSQLMKSEAVKRVLEKGWSRQEALAGVTKLVKDLGEECLNQDILIEIMTVINDQKHLSGQANSTRNEGQDSQHDNGETSITMGDNTPKEFDADHTISDSTTSSQIIPQEESSSTNSEIILRLLEREHSYWKKRLYCLVCGQNKIGCIYLPCGHVVACQSCGDQASICILCEKVISAMANIFMS